MEGLLTRLSEILEEEGCIYKAILDLSIRKTQVIVDGKVTRLEQLTDTEQQMIIAVGRLEEERESILQKIEDSTDIDDGKVRIDTIVHGLSGELKQRLLTAKDDILVVLGQLKERNALNSRLIQKSLEYINFSINLVVDSTSNSTYGASQCKGKELKEGIRIFDQKV